MLSFLLSEQLGLTICAQSVQVERILYSEAFFCFVVLLFPVSCYPNSLTQRPVRAHRWQDAKMCTRCASALEAIELLPTGIRLDMNPANIPHHQTGQHSFGSHLAKAAAALFCCFGVKTTLFNPWIACWALFGCCRCHRIQHSIQLLGSA